MMINDRKIFGNAFVTGVLSATSFIGNGSGLTGVVATAPDYIISFTLLNNDTVIPAGVINLHKSIPVAADVSLVRISSTDTLSGDLAIKVLRNTVGALLSTVNDITNGNPPSLSANSYTAYTPSGWTSTSFTTSQWIGIEVINTPTLKNALIEFVMNPS